MTHGQSPVASILLKTVNTMALYRNPLSSILGVFRHSMITARKDLKPGANDFEKQLNILPD